MLFNFETQGPWERASFEHVMNVVSREITKYLPAVDQHRLALCKAEWWRRMDQTIKPIPEIGRGTDLVLGELSVHHWDVSRPKYIMAATVVSEGKPCQLCVVYRSKPGVVVTYSFPDGEAGDEAFDLWRVAISDGLPVIYLESEDHWANPKIYRCLEQHTTLQAVTPSGWSKDFIVIGVAYTQGHMFVLYKTDFYKSCIGIATKPRGAGTKWVERQKKCWGHPFHFYGNCKRDMTVDEDTLTVYCMLTPPQATVIQIVVAPWKAEPIIRTITVDDPRHVTVHRLSTHAPCLIVTDRTMCELPRMLDVKSMLPASDDELLKGPRVEWLDDPATPDCYEFTLYGRVVITASGNVQVPVKYEPNKSSCCKIWYPVMLHTARGVDGKVVTAFVDKGVYYAIVKMGDSIVFRSCAPTPTWKTIGRRACGINPDIHPNTFEDQQLCLETFRQLMKVDATRERVQDWAQTDDGPLATCIETHDSAALDTMLKIIKPYHFPGELWRMIGLGSSIAVLECFAAYAATYFGKSVAKQGTELALETAVQSKDVQFLLGYHARSIEPQQSLAWWVRNSPSEAFLESIAEAYSRPQAVPNATCVLCLADVDTTNKAVGYSCACSCSAGVYHTACLNQLALQQGDRCCPQCKTPFDEVAHHEAFEVYARNVNQAQNVMREQEALKNRVSRFQGKLKQTARQRDDAVNSLSVTQLELDGLRKRARYASER